MAPDPKIIIYTFETLREAKHEELVQQVNMLLKETAKSTNSGADRALLLFQAQLPMSELVRRDQEAQTRAMLGYTKWVTIMTLIIGVMTIVQTVEPLKKFIHYLTGSP